MKQRQKPIRVPDLVLRKRQKKIAMLTAYDAGMARILDQAGIDILLVGDSLGVVVLGLDTTLPVTLEAMLHHTKAVRKGCEHALIVADMPFLTYQISVEEAVRNAGRLLQEGGAAAVKLEGGQPIIETVKRLVVAGIPVMGHLGLRPQSVHQMGGFRRQAVTPAEQARLLEDAVALEEAGAFAIVLECIPENLAEQATSKLKIPTIGIGSGPHCDGQVLVINDILGLSENPPPFARQYCNLAETIHGAVSAYVDDVRANRFPESQSPVYKGQNGAMA